MKLTMTNGKLDLLKNKKANGYQYILFLILIFKESLFISSLYYYYMNYYQFSIMISILDRHLCHYMPNVFFHCYY